MDAVDPIKLEVFRNIFSSVAEEMGVALCRTAFSPNIKERRDFSCAIFDGEGKMVAQAVHIPVHLGSMPLSVLSAVRKVEMQQGDVVILNDPFEGGTHLPDITLVSAVYRQSSVQPLFYVANRAHHADVGGITPGSMALSTEIFQEGIRIPPVKLVEGGRVNEGLMAFLLSNVRTPEEREGDLTAQMASVRIGETRLLEVLDAHGATDTVRYMRELQAYAERMVRKAIEAIPDGEYSFSDFMDDDGVAPEPVEIRVKIMVEGDEAVVDFAGTAGQVQGSINAVYAITLSAVFYVFRSILDQDAPSNAGCMVPVRVIAPEGSVVNAAFPAAVAGGNVETSQRMVDVLLGALSKAIPERIPAASSGTMTNVTLGGQDPIRGKPFAYYETIGGGMGARPGADGLDAIHTHMTNTMNTPIEALENAYPFRVLRNCVRRASGGKGKYRGGHGMQRDLEMLCDAQLTLLTDRRKTAPYGLFGGGPGQSGEALLIHSGQEEELPSKVNVLLRAGDVVSLRTPGGGGYGREDD